MLRGVVVSMSISVLIVRLRADDDDGDDDERAFRECTVLFASRRTGTGGFSFRRRNVRGPSTDRQKEELTVPRWNYAGPWRGASAP